MSFRVLSLIVIPTGREESGGGAASRMSGSLVQFPRPELSAPVPNGTSGRNDNREKSCAASGLHNKVKSI